MNEKELLELAAKASNFSFLHYTEERYPSRSGLVYKIDNQNLRVWNPRIDAGEALKLAVRLNLLIMPYPEDRAVRVTRLDQPETIVYWKDCKDELDATCLAITRAAAEIGRIKS